MFRLSFLDQASAVVSSETQSFEQQISTAQKWLENAYNWFIAFLPKLLAGVVIFIIGWWVTKLLCKLVKRAITKAKADPTVVNFLISVLSATLKVLVVICVLSTLGFDMTTIVTTVGAATVTVGLALKDSLANLASGTLIILHKKFKIGDYLETEGLKGNVVKIDMMYTTLCTYDNKEILIPNSRLTSNNIVNYFVQEDRRIDLIVPIAYSEDVQKAREVIMELINTNDMVVHKEGKRNRVAVSTLNESSVDLSVWIWCESKNYWILLEEMQVSIKSSQQAHHISIPFNQLDIHVVEDKTKQTKERKL